MFYHRTKEEAWEKIQEEGVLWGVTRNVRYTYLAPQDAGDSYGNVLLEVDYTPEGPPYDNYGFDPPPGQVCWQFSVFVPININKIKRIKQK